MRPLRETVMKTLRALGLLALALPACGGAQPSPIAVALAVQGDGGAALATPPPDLSAVPAPAMLALTASLARPTETLTLVAEIMKPIAPQLEALTLKDFVTLAFGDAVAEVVDLTRRVDIAVAETRETPLGSVLVSMPVLSLDDATRNLREDYRLVPRGDGIVALEPLDARRKKKESLKPMCELWPAAGAPPYRLLCATERGAFAAMGPYLVRTTPRVAVEADIHVEMFPASLRRSAAKAAADGGALTSAPAEMGRQLALELFEDLRGLAFDVTLDRAHVELVMTSRLETGSAPLGRLLAGEPDRAAPIAPAFFRLPIETSAAMISHGTRPHTLSKLRDEIFGAAVVAGGIGRMSEDARRRMSTVLTSLFLTGGPVVVGYGFDDAAARAAVARAGSKAATPPRAPLHPWVLVALDEPAERWITAGHEIVALSHESSSAPAEKKPDAPTRSTLVEVKPRPADGLPPGSVHFEDRVALTPRGKGEKKVTPHTTHMFVVPVSPPQTGTPGAQTWLAFGEDEAVVRAKLRVALGGPQASRLEAREGVQALRTGVLNWGGFVTPAALRSLALPDEWPSNVKEILPKLDPLGGKAQGEGAVVLVARASGDGAEPSAPKGLEVHVHVPRDTLDAAVRAVADKR